MIGLALQRLFHKVSSHRLQSKAAQALKMTSKMNSFEQLPAVPGSFNMF